eukprot:m.239166 g.239166  ORF g.239166 m.239166 type:complete len:1465 (-) comp22368_c0_seq1:77-4471(-)
MPLRAEYGWGTLAVLLLLGLGLIWKDNLPAHTFNRSHQRPSTILITGAAGFIGFHTAQRLLRDSENVVVGIDNFDPYYDVSLKHARIQELAHNSSFIFQRGDVCNTTLLAQLFREYRFTHVVHFAGKAGVRASVAAPHEYVANNIGCFRHLLAAMTQVHPPRPALVFASSSSVYGVDAPLPFNTRGSPSFPASVYGATKRAMEAMARSTTLHTTALRFFTVYGPWGRPDMAVAAFAESILAGKPVSIFEGNMTRDFTYIDDVIDGIVAALNPFPAPRFRVFNLGGQQVSSLQALVALLEKELGRTAITHTLARPATEKLATSADIDEAATVLHFRPKVSLAVGIRRFVFWLQGHRDRQQARVLDRFDNVSGDEGPAIGANIMMKRQEHNALMHAQRQRDLALFTAHTGLPSPVPHEKTYLFHRGVVAAGGDLARYPDASVAELEARCNALEVCIAFSSDGTLKRRVAPRDEWVQSGPLSGGLYVAGNVDMCLQELHDCPLYARCVKTGPVAFDCVCADGFVSEFGQCVPISPAHQQDHLALQDTEPIASSRRFVVFTNKTVPGHSIGFFPGLNVFQLQAECLRHPKCVAFTSNGFLKHSLPLARDWSTSPLVTLYVADIDHCALQTEGCFEHSTCVKTRPGQHDCMCVAPYRLVNTAGRATAGAARSWECHLPLSPSTPLSLAPRPTIPIVFCVDDSDIEGVAAAIQSIWQHDTAGAVSIIVAHAFTRPSSPSSQSPHSTSPLSITQQLLCRGLNSTLLNDSRRFRVVEVDMSKEIAEIAVFGDASAVGNLAAIGNFARFHMHQFISSDYAIYADSDLVFLEDPSSLITIAASMGNSLLAGVPRASPTYGATFSPRVQTLFYERTGHAIDVDAATFNAGFYVINLRLWREQHLESEVSYWMATNKREHLWALGTQPILQLLAHKQWTALPTRWNVDGLGYRQDSALAALMADAAVLHWSGVRKPWLAGGMYREHWAPYAMPLCAHHGRCTAAAAACVCDAGREGPACELLSSTEESLNFANDLSREGAAAVRAGGGRTHDELSEVKLADPVRIDGERLALVNEATVDPAGRVARRVEHGKNLQELPHHSTQHSLSSLQSIAAHDSPSLPSLLSLTSRTQQTFNNTLSVHQPSLPPLSSDAQHQAGTNSSHLITDSTLTNALVYAVLVQRATLPGLCPLLNSIATNTPFNSTTQLLASVWLAIAEDVAPLLSALIAGPCCQHLRVLVRGGHMITLSPSPQSPPDLPLSLPSGAQHQLMTWLRDGIAAQMPLQALFAGALDLLFPNAMVLLLSSDSLVQQRPAQLAAPPRGRYVFWGGVEKEDDRPDVFDAEFFRVFEEHEGHPFTLDVPLLVPATALFVDTALLASRHVRDEMLYWSRFHPRPGSTYSAAASPPLWRSSTPPLLTILGHGALDAGWVQTGVGFLAHANLAAVVLVWSGSRKPWAQPRPGYHADHWFPYRDSMCSF